MNLVNNVVKLNLVLLVLFGIGNSDVIKKINMFKLVIIIKLILLIFIVCIIKYGIR